MLGKPVPDFSLAGTGGSTFRNTPGCTQQGSDFRDAHAQAIRRDPAEQQVRKKVRGIERSTFVIDEKRRVVREWRGVKVQGHVQEVLNFAKAL